jgi:glycine dehydrogenase subunit 1
MLQACIYLAAMGKAGLRKAAELCWNKAHYAASLIASLPGFALGPPPGERPGAMAPFFKEFLVRTPVPAEGIARKLSRRGVVPGLPMSRYYPERTHELLVCVTEMCTRGQIELLARSLGEAAE